MCSWNYLQVKGKRQALIVKSFTVVGWAVSQPYRLFLGKMLVWQQKQHQRRMTMRQVAMTWIVWVGCGMIFLMADMQQAQAQDVCKSSYTTCVLRCNGAQVKKMQSCDAMKVHDKRTLLAKRQCQQEFSTLQRVCIPHCYKAHCSTR